MFEPTIDSLKSAIDRHEWVSELAGILPLSALIDFIETPIKLHILELAGTCPLWSWAITPSGSRLLLAEPRKVCGKPVRQDCYMDRFGNSPAIEALDGRYGERYFVNSPETLRLLLDGTTSTPIQNDHRNMTDEGLVRRVQNVEVIHFIRQSPAPLSRTLWETSSATQLRPSSASLFARFRRFLTPVHKNPFLYRATALVGWFLLIGTLVASIILQFWICFAFVLLLPITGTIVSLLYGAQPRKLLVDSQSDYVRVLILADHVNTDDWKIVIGESSVVNSLINRPLEPSRPHPNSTRTAILRQLLRLCVLGQWGLAIASATEKYWDAYLICFWIAFPIFCHAYLITPSFCAKGWLEQQTGINVRRYNTQASTRRSLLNLIVALNPDSFDLGQDGGTDYSHFSRNGLKWIDPILTPCKSRDEWEDATREATPAALKAIQSVGVNASDLWDPDSDFPSQDWNKKWRISGADGPGQGREAYYWRRFIPEGIYLAAKIKAEANLPCGKFVDGRKDGL